MPSFTSQRSTLSKRAMNPMCDRFTAIRHALLFAILSIVTVPCTADEKRPNIVFLFSDDQTSRAIGCAGNSDIITPHLDQLAKDGVRFTNHYNTTSICMASRCTVLTTVRLRLLVA